MKSVPVDLEMLKVALEDTGGMTHWYLDLETGDLIPQSDDYPMDELDEDFDLDSERFVLVDPIASHDGFRIMESFALQLPPQSRRCQQALQKALDGKRPFRRFKDTLTHWPREREQWFAYHDACMSEHAEQWLHFQEIEATPRPPYSPPA